MPEPKPHILNDQELATVLGSLRHYQETFLSASMDIDNIVTNGGTMKRLSSMQIDSLCERLNQ